MLKSFILLSMLVFVFACGHSEGIIQKAEKSFIVFTGNLENVKVQIDDLEPIFPSPKTHYQLFPGRHQLSAFRDGILLLDRVVILENQVTMEITMP